ncbi:MAG: hypothetical protein GY943_30295 [Chloroflexi bacterium]|nr:hypothetical protein [Chloroflexota bacterium]
MKIQVDSRVRGEYRVIILFFIIGVSLFLLYQVIQAGVGFDNPVPSLPPDNLLSYEDAWFRDLSAPPEFYPGGWGNWVNEDEKGSLSRGAEKNPSPDDLDGTAVQWDEETGCMQTEQCHTHIIVPAPNPHTGLQFQFWQVSRNLEEGTAVIFGCAEATCSNETPIWSPWVAAHGAIHWQQEPLTTILLSESYPYYKLRLTCQYAGGNAGCKYTGIYLALLVTDDIVPTITPIPPPTPEPKENQLYLPIIVR